MRRMIVYDKIRFFTIWIHLLNNLRKKFVKTIFITLFHRRKHMGFQTRANGTKYNKGVSLLIYDMQILMTLKRPTFLRLHPGIELRFIDINQWFVFYNQFSQ